MQSAGPPKRAGAKSKAGGPDTPEDSGPTLFDAADPDEGQRRRDEGVQAARHNTHPGYRLEVDRVIGELADAGTPFTAEDVRARSGPPLASSPNALGAAISAAAKAGTIETVGYQPATRPEAHGRILRVWQGVR